MPRETPLEEPETEAEEEPETHECSWCGDEVETGATCSCQDRCPRCDYCTDDCECTHCDRCDEPYYAEECPNCETVILEHNYRIQRYFDAIPEMTEATKKTLYLGVELEVEAKEGKFDAARTFTKHSGTKDWCITKSDGSLDDGFEVVTVPAHLPEHQKRWPELLTVLRETCTSWKNKTTGLHVHLSKAFFTQYEIAKFVLFINAEETRRYIVTLAGRTSPEYARIKKKYGYDVLDDSSGRYQAVNLENSLTIEVRIFKGTLNEEHMLAYVEFCDALARWVKINSLSECNNWAAFMSFVEKNKKVYKNLWSYKDKMQEKVEKLIQASIVRSTGRYEVTLNDEGAD